MKKVFNLLIIALIGFASIFAVSAYQNESEVTNAQLNCDEMSKVFENLDYETWRVHVTNQGNNKRLHSFVDENNFETFVEFRNAKKNGEVELAAELKKELGFVPGNMGNGQQHQKMNNYKYN